MTTQKTLKECTDELAEKLGRKLTYREACDEVNRILRERGVSKPMTHTANKQLQTEIVSMQDVLHDTQVMLMRCALNGGVTPEDRNDMLTNLEWASSCVNRIPVLREEETL